MHQSFIRRALAPVGLLGAGLALMAAPAIAQDNATPSGSPVTSTLQQPAASPEAGLVNVIIYDKDGNNVGAAVFKQEGNGVAITVQVKGLPPGEHGIHLHEYGVCNGNGAQPFDGAGAHFNPTGAKHGSPLLATPNATVGPDQAHAGDLGNITVGQNGEGTLKITDTRVSLEPGGPNSLADGDGTAIVIHADKDDLMTDPSGNSGARIACGIVFGPQQGGATASPQSSPSATKAPGSSG